MEQIGIRELRQHASVWIRRVKAGESFEVTERGQPVALLVPPTSGGLLAQLEAAGRLSRAELDILDLGPPLPARDDLPPPSRILEELRADER